MELKQLGSAQYIALETFKKNGTSVNTPVWVAPQGDKLYVWTEATSWKVKRIRNNSQVRLAESDAIGNPKSEWVTAQTQVLDSDEDIRQVEKLFKSKYRFQFTLWKLRGRKNKHVAIEIMNR